MNYSHLGLTFLVSGVVIFGVPIGDLAARDVAMMLDQQVVVPLSDEKDAPPEKDPTSCVSHTTQARYIMGYDHLVHIDNACAKSVECTVSTDVNPAPQTVTLNAKSKQTVVTFKGSPARVFRAIVSCKLLK